MLVRSHSVPNVNTFDRAACSRFEESRAVRGECTSGFSVFMHDASDSMLRRVDAVIQRLNQNLSSRLNGESLEVLSLAIVNNDCWPSDLVLAWKYDASEEPHIAFHQGREGCPISPDIISNVLMRTVEVSHDGKGDYVAEGCGGHWEASGDESFFKLMLAIKMGVAVENISEQQAAGFRREMIAVITEQRVVLAGRLMVSGIGDSRVGNTIDVFDTPFSSAASQPIQMQLNPDWVNPETRLACKYSPVIVNEAADPDVLESMQAILDNRIKTCRELSMERAMPGDGGWFSFLRGPQLHQPHLHSGTVPTIVISGGSANKLAAELSKDYSLVWHPKNMSSDLDRAEPVYLLVHKMDYPSYASAMKETLAENSNLHLVGWDGGELTGFGAARASALAFADTLPYSPNRIVMVDQDVVKTEQTRPTNPQVRKNIEQLHQLTEKPVVGYGVGYPTRQQSPRPFSNTGAPELSDFNSPAQQFVSIKAPFRMKWDDGMYPPYMVAGGEDMLMGQKLGLIQDKKNSVLLAERIVKKELEGASDVPNAYWNDSRVRTLEKIFERERTVPVEFEGERMSLEDLMVKFKSNGWIQSHPSAESYNVAACIVERVILRLNKELAKSTP